MVQKRETKATNKLCVREILSLSFVCGAYFFEFRGRNLVCFVFAYNFNGKYAPEAGKTRMRTAFFTRVLGAKVRGFPGVNPPGWPLISALSRLTITLTSPTTTSRAFLSRRGY